MQHVALFECLTHQLLLLKLSYYKLGKSIDEAVEIERIISELADLEKEASEVGT